MYKKIVSILGLIAVAVAAPVFAATDPQLVVPFRQYVDIASPQISVQVPTIVEVPLQGFVERPEFLVKDSNDDTYVPSLYLARFQPATLRAGSSGEVHFPQNLADNNLSTFTSFDVPGDSAVQSAIQIVADRQITSSSISLELEKNVALPMQISIRAMVDGRSTVVVANQKLVSTTVQFPSTRSDNWTITLTYIQPLRIRELRINDDSSAVAKRAVRFLAQPGHSYRMYLNPDEHVVVPLRESGNLADNSSIKIVNAYPIVKNPLYKEADSDNDGVPNITDNCIATANTDQADLDSNGIGDVCQDFDHDNVSNEKDNCVNVPNARQEDTDGDGMGDACDTEESRITEKYSWIPWAGIGFAGIVIVLLFALTAMPKPEEATVVQKPKSDGVPPQKPPTPTA